MHTHTYTHAQDARRSYQLSAFDNSFGYLFLLKLRVLSAAVGVAPSSCSLFLYKIQYINSESSRNYMSFPRVSVIFFFAGGRGPISSSPEYTSHVTMVESARFGFAVMRTFVSFRSMPQRIETLGYSAGLASETGSGLLVMNVLYKS